MGKHVVIGVLIIFLMKFILMCEARTVLASELELCCFQQDMRHVNCCFDDFVTCSLIL